MPLEEAGLKKVQEWKARWSPRSEGGEENSGQKRRNCVFARQSLLVVSSRGNKKNK